jgi:mycothiol synthase
MAEQAVVQRPSLKMLRPHLDGLPSLEEALAALPAGYHFRTYQPGDEGGWAALMNTGQMGEWTAGRTVLELTGRPRPQFDPEGLFLITAGPDGVPAGSACAWLLDPNDKDTGILHMVCVLPEHRGRRLSYALCLAVLHRFRQRGFQRVALSTNDWRLGAVKVYLELGFQPVYRHPMHPQQWQEVVRQLGWAQPVQPILEEAAAR